MTSPRQLIKKAASLLDLKGDAAGAEKALREAIELATIHSKHETVIEAKTFLGDVLVETGRHQEALALFEEVFELARVHQVEPDLVDPHLRTARAHVAKARGPE